MIIINANNNDDKNNDNDNNDNDNNDNDISLGFLIFDFSY